MRGSIHGYVLRGDTGAPVFEAKVTIKCDTDPSWQTEVPSSRVSTNAAGWFAFHGLREGTWTLDALGPAGGRGQAKIPVFDDAVSQVTIKLNGLHRWMATLASAEFVDQMSDVSSQTSGEVAGIGEPEPWAKSKSGGKQMSTGGIRGRVVYEGSGAPVDGATIGIVRGARPAPDIAPLTDADGRFALDGLPPGRWILRAIAPDGAEGTADIRVAPSDVSQVSITVRRPMGRTSSEGTSEEIV